MSAPCLSKRAQAAVDRLAGGRTLCARTDRTEEGIRSGGLMFWLEPGGQSVGPSTARELIEKGVVKPQQDGLLPDAPQSWRLA